MKRILSIILVFIMLLSSRSTYAFASEVQESNQMDSIDVIITGYSYVAGCSTFLRDANMKIKVTNIVPLYNLSDEIVAYYVTFSSNEYAVVNNNVENPVAIEFGEGKQQYIEEILSNCKNPKVIYNNPVSVYEESVINTLLTNTKKEIKSIEDYYPELSQKNEELALKLKSVKKKVEELGVIKVTRGDGDYGFLMRLSSQVGFL